MAHLVDELKRKAEADIAVMREAARRARDLAPEPRPGAEGEHQDGVLRSRAYDVH